MSEEGFQRFVELAGEYNLVPVTDERLADGITPVGAFRSIVGDGPGFLLESVEHGERWSRFSFLGRSPLATMVARGGEVAVTAGTLPDAVPLGEGVLCCLEGLLAAYRAPKLSELAPFTSGLVGYLGYDIVREVERLGAPPEDDLGLPDAVVSVVGELVAFDHHRQRAILIDNVALSGGEEDGHAPSGAELEQRYRSARQRLSALRRDLERPVPEPLVRPPDRGAHLEADAVRSVMGSARYQAAVEAAKEYILAGDAFQIVLSQRFDL